MIDHWGVDVRINGTRVLTIESNCLSGRDLSEEELNTVGTCGNHLLAFSGGNYDNQTISKTIQNIYNRIESLESYVSKQSSLHSIRG